MHGQRNIKIREYIYQIFVYNLTRKCPHLAFTSTIRYTRYQDTTMYNFRYLLIHEYFMYTLPDDQPVGTQTCWSLRSALFCDITHRTFVIPYRRFGTIYRSHLQRSMILGFLTLEVCTKPTGSVSAIVQPVLQ
jgi:hypothetical protein